MAAKPKDIITDVEMKLGHNNAIIDYPGKMITIGTLSIALYWLTMVGMVVYSIHYHNNNTIEQSYER